GWLTVDGVVAARDPHFFPQHDVAHHRPGTLLLFEADEPDHTEDVTGFADTKVAALLEHRSQFESTMHVRYAQDEQAIARFRTRIDAELVAAGAPAGFAHGEQFKRITDL